MARVELFLLVGCWGTAPKQRGERREGRKEGEKISVGRNMAVSAVCKLTRQTEALGLGATVGR